MHQRHSEVTKSLLEASGQVAETSVDLQKTQSVYCKDRDNCDCAAKNGVTDHSTEHKVRWRENRRREAGKGRLVP